MARPGWPLGALVVTIRAMHETLGKTLRIRLGRTLVALDRLRPAPAGLRPVPLAIPVWNRYPIRQRPNRPVRS